MFSLLAITALLSCSVLFVRADPNPNSPGPGDVYNEGAQCPIGWDVDTTGIWKVMNIELMTGSNLDMVHLTTVATVDGTDSAANTFTWTCPGVTPNSAIYFYQFTSPASNTTMWTTRFAIADATGQTTTPPQATQPGGQAIPWGTGALSNPADAKPPPTGAATSAASSTPLAGTSSVSSSSSSSSASASASASVVGSSPSSSSAGTSKSSTTKSATGTAGSGAAASPSSTNAAMATLAVNDLIFQTILALGVAAAGFTVLL